MVSSGRGDALSLKTDEGALVPVKGEGPQQDQIAVASPTLTEYMAAIVDTLERIQQQLAEMNEGANLAPGERLYNA